MKLILAVASDLWEFACIEWRQLWNGSESSRQLHTDLYSPTIDWPVVPNRADVVATESPVYAAAQPNFSLQQTVYACYPNTPCYLRPGIVLDTIIGHFNYAQALTVIAQKDNWVRVRSGALEGWTEVLQVTQHIEDVLPTLEAGSVYDAQHPETMKLRTYIQNEFGAESLNTPITDCEYVWYRLLLAGRNFSWPLLRPRTSGRWSEILRTEQSVLVSSVPFTASVMEYTEGSTPYLYYVESVSPDERIAVSGFEMQQSGILVQREYAKTEWKSLQPKFICKK